MGVPALFRWLSKKYPKIILPVVEEDETKIPDGDGNEVAVPIDISRPNPNDTEFDNLYLDMNGIVHPCTHPDGKPAPETEEDMMLEIFAYTERVVNMVRPRKLLFMAIDGVAPRAKMNQQRSRRFRASQEAKEKEEARKEAVAMFEAMGHAVSDGTKDKQAWDYNAITPGTPFMDLLAASLRYWVARKINTDPGWKDLQVILSDASVPGEGEHKIMDFIRRQRTNPHHDPNTHHVIYGLDADLIMLSLATHEPHFRVLREDVFHQEGSKTACRICGQEGHYAAQCTGEKKVKQDEHDVKKAPEKKPFIFLDVATLREYLEVELNVSYAPFPFDLERAIDDWVLLIFFVGNDFLPHLPSLEIREGAVDTLLKIWKDELPRMGGYLTNHGQVELSRAEVILEGLAKREDDIFRRRRETEERQDQNAKRRKIEASGGGGGGGGGGDGGMRLGETTYVPVETNAPPPIHPSLPQRPAFDVAAPAKSSQPSSHAPQAALAQDGITLASNHDVVANRRAIRMANMNAAEMLKAELAGRASVQTSQQLADENVVVPRVPATASDAPVEPPPVPLPSVGPLTSYDDYASMDVLPGLGGPQSALTPDPVGTPNPPLSIEAPSILSPPVDVSVPQSGADALPPPDLPPVDTQATEENDTMDMDVPVDVPVNGVNGTVDGQETDESRGTKRKLEDAMEREASFAADEEEAPDVLDAPAAARKVNPDGTVEQEDTVKLWEPGYKERYYRQKFGVELSDLDFRKQLTKSYVEGLAWVLHYYYQGTPSWQWYYPYHYAPFAADFEEVSKMDIKFNIGQPFKAFEQLMGVFPPASRKHIPETFHSLMLAEDSPIFDFYPTTFDIDMNGKKMAWQGVALLPFIDEKRLLDAMAPRYPELKEEEVRRNKWGSNVLFVGHEHGLHAFLSGLYVKRKSNDPISLDTKLTKGIAGSVLPDPQCIPDSTYFSPFEQVSLPDIPDNRALSALYYYPRQLKPHRSQLLAGVKRPMRVLTSADYETLHRRGGRGRGRDGGPPGWGGGRGSSYGTPTHGSGPGYDRDRGGYGYGSYGPSPGPYSGNASGGRGAYGSNPYSQGYNTGYGQNYGGGRDYGSYGSNGYSGSGPNGGYSGSGYAAHGRGRGR